MGIGITKMGMGTFIINVLGLHYVSQFFVSTLKFKSNINKYVEKFVNFRSLTCLLHRLLSLSAYCNFLLNSHNYIVRYFVYYKCWSENGKKEWDIIYYSRREWKFFLNYYRNGMKKGIRSWNGSKLDRTGILAHLYSCSVQCHTFAKI